jgi:hypothetical protein
LCRRARRARRAILIPPLDSRTVGGRSDGRARKQRIASGPPARSLSLSLSCRLDALQACTAVLRFSRSGVPTVLVHLNPRPRVRFIARAALLYWPCLSARDDDDDDDDDDEDDEDEDAAAAADGRYGREGSCIRCCSTCRSMSGSRPSELHSWRTRSLSCICPSAGSSPSRRASVAAGRPCSSRAGCRRMHTPRADWAASLGC